MAPQHPIRIICCLSLLLLVHLAPALTGRAESPEIRPVDYELPPGRVVLHTTLTPPRMPSACSDFDGDGWSPDGGECGPIDCDDGDPLVNPGAAEICDGIDNDCDGAIEERFLDQAGAEYCLDMLIDTGRVGQEIPITVYGYHESGIYELTLVPLDSVMVGAPDHYCALVPYCQWETTLPALDFPGAYSVYAQMTKGSNQYAAGAYQQVSVVCPDEYCAPDPLYLDFITWMREKGYKESIISHYADLRYDHEVLWNLRFDLRLRPYGLTPPWTLTFWEVVPTDTEATYSTLGLDEGPPCEPGSQYVDWCQSPEPTDYKFIEEHFESTFGFDFEFNYRRLEINYKAEFDEPLLMEGTVADQYRFSYPYSFRSSFPKSDIVHMAMDTWKGVAVEPFTTAQSAAFIQRVLGETVSRIVVYTHEWGHTTGLRHSFVGNHTAGYRFWALDGVMENSYRHGDPPVLDLLDPVERYVLEPVGGYNDEATYVDVYNDDIIGTIRMWDCLMVDPEIVNVTVIGDTPTETTYRITLANVGNTSVSYVPLAALLDDEFGPLMEERIIERIEPGTNITPDFTIAKSVLGSGSAVFVLDRDDLIAEISDHPESACINPIQCGDVDNDSYTGVGDVIFLANYVFKSGPAPLPLWTADVNGVGDGVAAADIIYIISHIFRSGPAPVCSEP